MPLMATGANDTTLVDRSDGDDDGAAKDDATSKAEDTGKVDETIKVSDSEYDFGKGDPGSKASDSDSTVVPPKEIGTADELGGISPGKAAALGLADDEPTVDLEAELVKTEPAPGYEPESEYADSVPGSDPGGEGDVEVADAEDEPADAF